MPIPSSSIIDIFIDSRDRMWIGSMNGLSYYDLKSKTLKSYFTIEGDDNSLSSNYIYCIYEDREHNIWVGTQNGLNFYSSEFNKFKYLKHLYETKKQYYCKNSTRDLLG
ncbi:MAG: hypothetical protein HC830_14100, partial [Bacteroidetes bacterium]|nr:hypothetical protein [Bacteroidota bacterium]